MYQVRTTAESRPISGSDSCILELPVGVLVERPGGEPVVNISVLGRLISYVSSAAAAEMGETLHHAEWHITSDADQVEKIGMHETPDCARCRACVDQALTHLAATGKPLLVGVVYWAG